MLVQKFKISLTETEKWNISEQDLYATNREYHNSRLFKKFYENAQKSEEKINSYVISMVEALNVTFPSSPPEDVLPSYQEGSKHQIYCVETHNPGYNCNNKKLMKCPIEPIEIFFSWSFGLSCRWPPRHIITIWTELDWDGFIDIHATR